MIDRVEIVLRLLTINFTSLPGSDVRKMDNSALKEYFVVADNIVRLDLELPTPTAKPNY